jgi:beta-glucosidase/6-phospho-beta-glucosidase/beta-galactosidase
VGGNPLERMGVKACDMELVKAPLDFFGMNYYQRTIIAAAQPNKNRLGVDLTDSGGTDGPKTDMGWEFGSLIRKRPLILVVERRLGASRIVHQ